MSHHFKETPHNAITDSGIARVIDCKELDLSDPFKWLVLGLKDFQRAPLISFFYGLVFTTIPTFIFFLMDQAQWHMVGPSATIVFVLIGPFLAAGMYDVSWELEKGHKPSIMHSIKAIRRNAVNEWAFGVLLAVILIFWLRVASMIHALFPPMANPPMSELMPFLIVGTIVGALFTTLVFFISAFTQPTLMERRVDLATAMLTSMNAVWVNKVPMMIWASIIFAAVAIGYFTYFFAFLVLMPLIGYGTWHAYIDTIETKRERHFE